MRKLLPVMEYDGDVLGGTKMLLIREIKGCWPQKSDPLPIFLSAEIWKIVSAFELILVCSRF